MPASCSSMMALQPTLRLVINSAEVLDISIPVRLQYNLLDPTVEQCFLKQCIDPSVGLLGVNSHTELLSGVSKKNDALRCLHQFALEIINCTPEDATLVYTDGSQDDDSHSAEARQGDKQQQIPCFPEEEYLPGMKKIPDFFEQSNDSVTLSLKGYSSFLDSLLSIGKQYSKIVHVLAFIFRFINNCKFSCQKKPQPLSPHELDLAECYLTKKLPQTVWLQTFPWPPSDQHTTITGTKAEPPFIRKHVSTLSSTELWPDTTGVAMATAWSKWNTRYKAPGSELTLK
ncbi:hypothetical protein TNCV_1879491 [Trichonephila clavipes]|nr:hypothetical protein TNCV_1879491 [Trichonephila clavipes]